MNNSNKLKPCPFCGSDDVYLVETRTVIVECGDCNAHGPVMKVFDEEAPIRLWNERAGDDVAGVEISADGMSVTVVKDGYGYEYTLADFYSEKGTADANGHE